tara:strand:- start:601 stop:1077 length:477 start_codon:yes stop_codon:yes gene_type:complete
MIHWKTRNVQWLNAESEPISMDHIIESLKSKPGYEIHIGCDSHRIGGQYIFAIVIAGYVNRRGGTFFFHRKKSKDPQLDNMKIRLMKEVELAIAVANQVRLNFPNKEISVHLDLNPKPEFPSYKVLPNAVSWVKSCGFNALTKPHSWASSSLADSFAK